MSLTNSSHYRLRIWNNFFSANWQNSTEDNAVADVIINTPEKYLLSQGDLYRAEGGNSGFALQVLGLALGVGAVFAASPRYTAYWRNASLKWTEWSCILGAGFVGYRTAHYVSVNALGDARAYQNHWMAYNFVKSCNRWEGRQILTKRPGNY